MGVKGNGVPMCCVMNKRIFPVAEICTDRKNG